MGSYINPASMPKEEWLERNARSVEEPQEFVGGDERLVILVDNGPFTAAAIAHSEKEFDYFMGLNDPRPRKYFVATVADLLLVSNLDQYL